MIKDGDFDSHDDIDVNDNASNLKLFLIYFCFSIIYFSYRLECAANQLRSCVNRHSDFS